MKSSPPLFVEISPGELIDKITILEIKRLRISDTSKLQNVVREIDLLEQSRDQAMTASEPLQKLTAELRAVNETLWEIEDEIRICERDQEFGATFVKLARSVYRTNDIRAQLKRQINELLSSAIVEEKHYVDYDS